MKPATKRTKPKLERENYGGEDYEYYPLGEYIVVAPGVCGSRPTFKYTRLEPGMILARIGQGDSIEKIIHNYAESKLTREAIQEALRLASEALVESTRSITHLK